MTVIKIFFLNQVIKSMLSLKIRLPLEVLAKEGIDIKVLIALIYANIFNEKNLSFKAI